MKKALKIIGHVILSILAIPTAFIAVIFIWALLGWICSGFSNDIETIMETGKTIIVSITAGGFIIFLIWSIWYVLFSKY